MTGDDALVWPVSDEGVPHCADPAGCSVCVLFGEQGQDETRSQWLTRLRDTVLALAGEPIPLLPVRDRGRAHADQQRWSKQWDQCQGVGCQTPWRPHQARGLCQSCYARYERRGQEIAS